VFRSLRVLSDKCNHLVFESVDKKDWVRLNKKHKYICFIILKHLGTSERKLAYMKVNCR